MAAEQNKLPVRGLVEEAASHRNLDVLDEVADGEIARAARHRTGPFGDSFPDVRTEITDLIAEGRRRPPISRARAPTSGNGWAIRRPAGASTMPAIYNFRVTNRKLTGATAAEEPGQDAPTRPQQVRIAARPEPATGAGESPSVIPVAKRTRPPLPSAAAACLHPSSLNVAGPGLTRPSASRYDRAPVQPADPRGRERADHPRPRAAVTHTGRRARPARSEASFQVRWPSSWMSPGAGMLRGLPASALRSARVCDACTGRGRAAPGQGRRMFAGHVRVAARRPCARQRPCAG